MTLYRNNVFPGWEKQVLQSGKSTSDPLTKRKFALKVKIYTKNKYLCKQKTTKAHGD